MDLSLTYTLMLLLGGSLTAGALMDTMIGRRRTTRVIRVARRRLIRRPWNRVKRRARLRRDKLVALLHCVRSWSWTRDQFKAALRRQRNRHNAERVIARWKTLTEDHPYLDRSRVKLRAVNGFGWTMKIRLRPGVLVPAVAGLGCQIETLLHARRDTIRVDPGEHADELLIFRLLFDPLKATGRHAKAPKPVMIDVGLFDTGETVSVPATHHTLIAGRTGTGKSGLMNTIIAKLVTTWRDHATFYGIDMKGGVEFRNWESIFEEKPAFTIEDAEELLLYLVAEMERRQQTMQGRFWDVNVDGPYIFILIDEIAMLASSKRATEALRKFAGLGRATGIVLVLATQRPTTGDKVIPAQVRTNITNTFCMRVERADDVLVVFGNEALREGWNTSDFDPLMPGLMKLRTMNYTRPRRARAFWLNDEEIVELARRHARTVAPTSTTQPSSVTSSDALTPARSPVGTSATANVDQALEARLLIALRDAPDGATRAELATITGATSSAVYRRLRKLRDDGHVHCDARGGSLARWFTNEREEA